MAVSSAVSTESVKVDFGEESVVEEALAIAASIVNSHSFVVAILMNEV